MRKSYFFLMVSLLCCFFFSHIEGVNYQLIQDLGSSARMIGLGNIEGFSADSSVVFDNPAGMYRMKRSSMSFFTASVMMGEVNYNQISLATPTTYGTFGIAYMEAGVYDFSHTGLINTGVIEKAVFLHTFDYKSTVMKLSYQNQVQPNVYYGVTGTLYGARFYDTIASGSNMDFGLIFDLRPVVVSLMVRNMIAGSQVDFRSPSGNAGEVLPTEVILATRYAAKELQLYGQYKYTQDKGLFSTGVSYSPAFSPMFEFLGGYKNYLVLGDIRSGLTCGVGLKFRPITIYYSFEKSDYFQNDNKNYFSMSIEI